ncbi:YheC/YheD family protein [Priestia aryabhattai]|uniref:YheC/YheD family protein n=1 Tax=Priestia aryabhattai TaxID=412384 RepID=UPI0039838349
MNSCSIPKPRIGICVSKKKRLLSELIEIRIKKFRGKGSFIKFYIEDLNLEKCQVKGEYFNRKTKQWEEGIFPFPETIYVQCYVDQQRLKEIEQVIGQKVFNNFIFDKWQGWELLSKDTVLQHSLPHTVQMKNKVDIKHFLYYHQDIILKPIDVSTGHSSRGIFRIKLQKNNIINVFFTKKQKIKEKNFESFDTFFEWISLKISTNEYIVQQSIQTVMLDKNATDIRLNMNKNAKGKWEVSLLLMRVATNSSYIIPSTVKILSIDKLVKLYPESKLKWNNIKNEAIHIGRRICHTFDKSGYHMANIGIDLGLDANEHLWIFEVNPLPHPLNGKDPSHKKPFEYACYLAST